MSAIHRRELHIALSAFVPRIPETATRATPTAERLNPKTLSESQVFSLDQIPVTSSANGGKRWNILQGALATGEAIAVHESLQPAGMTPNAAHTIQHSELILVQEGTLLFEYGGRSEKVGTGGVILVVPGTKHAARNVSDGPAKYLVIAVGGDTT